MTRDAVELLFARDLLLRLGNMSQQEFSEFAKKTWNDRAEHMTCKFWDQCAGDPWQFFIRLDDTAVAELANSEIS